MQFCFCWPRSSETSALLLEARPAFISPRIGRLLPISRLTHRMPPASSSTIAENPPVIRRARGGIGVQNCTPNNRQGPQRRCLVEEKCDFDVSFSQLTASWRLTSRRTQSCRGQQAQIRLRRSPAALCAGLPHASDRTWFQIALAPRTISCAPPAGAFHPPWSSGVS
jgi:hypothetical protein